MDAVAVSISSGMSHGHRARWGEALAMSATFGFFQAFMPAIGYAGGSLFKEAIESWAHWAAFVLLAAIGAKMIWESMKSSDGESEPKGNPFAPRSLVLLGIATSIDALAVGLTLSLLDFPAAASIAIIGFVTFALCLPAVRLGAKLGSVFAHRAEFAGGLVLVLIGLKILADHALGR
jgi:manganese efflux pump family protein